MWPHARMARRGGHKKGRVIWSPQSAQRLSFSPNLYVRFRGRILCFKQLWIYSFWDIYGKCDPLMTTVPPPKHFGSWRTGIINRRHTPIHPESLTFVRFVTIKITRRLIKKPLQNITASWRSVRRGSHNSAQEKPEHSNAYVKRCSVGLWSV